MDTTYVCLQTHIHTHMHSFAQYPFIVINNYLNEPFYRMDIPEMDSKQQNYIIFHLLEYVLSYKNYFKFIFLENN